MKAAAIPLLFLSLLPAAPAMAESRYQPAGLLHGGYRDRQVEPGVWKVSVGVSAESGMDAATRMALYRAAELAKSQGFTLVQVVWHRGGMRYQNEGRKRMRVLSHSAELKVRGLRSQADLGRCEMTQPSHCPVQAVDVILTRIGPTLQR
jgi:hypothetical protein